MLARRVPMLFASLAIVAVTQAPVPAHAESWSIFDWLRPAPQSTVDLGHDKLQAIRDGLWMVVNAGGTGGRARIKDHDVAGKTGTAQVISNQGKAAAGKTEKDLRDNGWFVFFAPRDNPQIAGVVFLEHGVHGGNAALVVHHILDVFFAKKDGRPLPPKPVLTPNLNPSLG